MPPLVRASFFHQEQTTDVGRITKGKKWTYCVHFLFFRLPMDAISSITDLVESLQRRGRYAFTRAEAASAMELMDRVPALIVVTPL